jgi:hypothetical protein
VKKLISILAIAAAILLNATSVQATSTTTGTPFQARLGKILGIVPTLQKGYRTGSLPCTPAGNNVPESNCYGSLYYNGGPVMTDNTVYTVFWVPPGYSLEPGYQPGMNKYFQDVQADNGKNSNVYDVQTQYAQGTGSSTRYIQYRTSFGGTVVDHNALPPLDPVNCPDIESGLHGQGLPPSPSLGNPPASTNFSCVTDAQIQQEISNVIKANSWPVDNHTEFFMFTAPNIGTCFPAQQPVSAGSVGTSVTAPLCSFQYFCAYHSWYFDSTVNPNAEIVYANMPYAEQTSGNPTSCTLDVSPNGDPAVDAEINVTSHEHIESITDPYGTGWWDSNPSDPENGYEIGDLCAWSFGPDYAALIPSIPNYTETINGTHYFMQQEWDNTTNNCVQKPSPEITLTPNIGYPTAPFRITGLFFNAGESVPFSFQSQGSASSEAVGSTSADATGHLTRLMTSVPSDAQPGTATVSGTGASSGTTATAPFTVPSP